MRSDDSAHSGRSRLTQPVALVRAPLSCSPRDERPLGSGAERGVIYPRGAHPPRIRVPNTSNGDRVGRISTRPLSPALLAFPDVAPDSCGNVAPWRDWRRLRGGLRVVCAAAPADESGGPPSGDTPSARSGAEVTTGETDTPARARSHPPRPRPPLRLTRRSVRRQGTRRVPAPAPK